MDRPTRQNHPPRRERYGDRIVTRISHRLWTRVRRLAAAREQRLSEVVRDALLAHLDRADREPPR